MNTQFTVDYFIKKFEAIPEERWNGYTQYRDEDNTRCAYGHCDTGMRGNGHKTPEGIALTNLLKNLPNLHWRFGQKFATCDYEAIPARINNGECKEYQQPTPKQRILAALYDIKSMQQPKHEDITKELAVLPADETSDIILKPQTA